MKKFVVLMLSIMLLGTMFVMNGCSKKISVEFTVEGVDDYAADYLGSNKNSTSLQRQELDPNAPAIYTFNVPGDGDYEMTLICTDGQTYPFTLKVHNGKVETEAPEGVTITATIKK